MVRRVAFSCYLYILYFNWAAVTGGRNSISLTSQSPVSLAATITQNKAKVALFRKPIKLKNADMTIIKTSTFGLLGVIFFV